MSGSVSSFESSGWNDFRKAHKGLKRAEISALWKAEKVNPDSKWYKGVKKLSSSKEMYKGTKVVKKVKPTVDLPKESPVVIPSNPEREVEPGPKPVLEKTRSESEFTIGFETLLKSKSGEGISDASETSRKREEIEEEEKAPEPIYVKAPDAKKVLSTESSVPPEKIETRPRADAISDLDYIEEKGISTLEGFSDKDKEFLVKMGELLMAKRDDKISDIEVEIRLKNLRKEYEGAISQSSSLESGSTIGLGSLFESESSTIGLGSLFASESSTIDSSSYDPAASISIEDENPVVKPSGEVSGTFATDETKVDYEIIHKIPITLFFGSVTKPQWDYELEKTIDGLDISSEDINSKIDALIALSGPKILVLKRVKDGSKQEFKEIMELHFSLERGMAKGSRFDKAVVPLSDLLKIAQGGLQSPQTPTDGSGGLDATFPVGSVDASGVEDLSAYIPKAPTTDVQGQVQIGKNNTIDAIVEKERNSNEDQYGEKLVHYYLANEIKVQQRDAGKTVSFGRDPKISEINGFNGTEKQPGAKRPGILKYVRAFDC